MIQSSRITFIRGRKARLMRVGNEIESGGSSTADLAMGGLADMWANTLYVCSV
jgi:hypothetical protein